MKNSELIKAVAGQTGDTIKNTEKVVKAFVEVVKKEIADNGELQINGLGKFKKKSQPERKGVNPATGAKITIPERTKVSFKASKEFLDLIN